MSDDDDSYRGGGFPGNNNAVKHHLFQDYESFWNTLDDGEKKLVVQLCDDLLERADTVDEYTLHVVRNAVLDEVKRARANEYLMKNWETYMDEPNTRKAYSKLRKDNREELKSLGLLKDNPDQKRADAEMGFWDALESDSDSEPDEE